MKTYFINTCLCLFTFCSAKSQITITPTATKPINPGVVFKGDWVTVFEKPNYQGLSKTFTITTDNLEIPFSSPRVSIKIKPGIKAYFKAGCEEFPSEFGILGDQPDVAISTRSLCGVRLAKAARVKISYRGILQEIHNNDCRRVYGKISYTVFELNEQGERINCRSGTSFSSPMENTVFEYSKGNTINPPGIFNINDFYLADRDYVSGVSWDPSRYKPSITSRPECQNTELEFWVGDNALYTKKVFLEVKIQLGSAHKSGDLSSDFTWDASMVNVETKTFELKTLAGSARFRDLSTLQIGPFRQATGGRVSFGGGGGYYDNQTQPGGTNFVGAPHTTYVQFNVER